MGEGESSLIEGTVCKASSSHLSRTQKVQKSRSGLCKVGDASAKVRYEKLNYA